MEDKELLGNDNFNLKNEYWKFCIMHIYGLAVVWLWKFNTKE